MLTQNKWDLSILIDSPSVKKITKAHALQIVQGFLIRNFRLWVISLSRDGFDTMILLPHRVKRDEVLFTPSSCPKRVLCVP